MAQMKITAVEISNYKRIRHVAIRPDADRVCILIGGRNAQGKTSLLDALSAAFGGKATIAADPVHRGADAAEIRVELDGDGDPVVIRRVVKPGGESVLEVREDGCKVRSPQAVLDKLIGHRFLDPLAFLALPPAAQRKALLGLVADADRLEELDRKRVRAFDRRTELGRDLRKAEAELERLPEVTPAAPIDVAALSLESRQIEERLRDLQSARAKRDTARRDRERAADELAAAQAALARAQEAVQRAAAELADAQAAEVAAAEAIDQVPGVAGAEVRRDEILFELRRAQDHNSAVAADQARAKRREQVAGEVAGLRSEVERCAAAIAEIDERKAAILAGAALPVPGLGVDDDGVTLNGIPLSQASGAERLRVALGLAIAAAPALRDVWIRDGALLDDESLALVADHAERAGVRVWIERVGTADPGAIVIHDGTIVD